MSTDRTPTATLYLVGSCLPLVAFPALPKWMRLGIDVLVRQAPPTSGGGKSLHIFYGLAVPSTERTPVAPLDVIRHRFPLMAFLALPKQVRVAVDVLIR